MKKACLAVTLSILCLFSSCSSEENSDVEYSAPAFSEEVILNNEQPPLGNEEMPPFQQDISNSAMGESTPEMMPDGTMDAPERPGMMENIFTQPDDLSKDFSWKFENDTLTISGNGAMRNFSAENGQFAPWYIYKKNIRKIIISEGITSIGSEAFSNCYAEEIDIADSVESIGDKAFYSCGITNISIGKNVTSIAINAFENCNSLYRITVSEENSVYSSYRDALYSKDQSYLIHCPEIQIQGDVSSAIN